MIVRKDAMASRTFLLPHRLGSVALCCLVLLWTGCSTFTHYPNQMEHSLQTFEAGRLEEASQSLEKKTKSGLDQLVYTLEDAMVSFHTIMSTRTSSEYEKSQ